MGIVIAIIGFIISIPLRSAILALQAQVIAINVADAASKTATGITAVARKTKFGSKILGKSSSSATKFGKTAVKVTEKATLAALTAAIASLKGLLWLLNSLVAVLQALDIIGLIIILVIVIILLIALSSVILFMNNENNQQELKMGISGGLSNSTSIVQEVDSDSTKLEQWQSVCEKMGLWYASHITTYEGNLTNTMGTRKNYTCELLKNADGTDGYVQDDCSAYVTACLQLAGYHEVGGQVYCTWDFFEGKVAGEKLKAAGFECIGSTQDNAGKLQEGDILLRDEHMEIFHHYDEKGQMYSWSWGDIYPNDLPHNMGDATYDYNQYSCVWRMQ